MTLLHDARVALRMWASRPNLPLLAVLSMTLAIAAATSVVVVTDAAVWRPLPVPGAGRVAWISSLDRQVAGDTSPGVFNAWTARSVTVTTLGALRQAEATLLADGVAERISGAQVTSGVFTALALHAQSGRLLSRADEQPGAPLVLVISDRLQRTRFAGAPVVGRIVTLDGRATTTIAARSAARLDPATALRDG